MSTDRQMAGEVKGHRKAETKTGSKQDTLTVKTSNNERKSVNQELLNSKSKNRASGSKQEKSPSRRQLKEEEVQNTIAKLSARKGNSRIRSVSRKKSDAEYSPSSEDYSDKESQHRAVEPSGSKSNKAKRKSVSRKRLQSKGSKRSVKGNSENQEASSENDHIIEESEEDSKDENFKAEEETEKISYRPNRRDYSINSGVHINRADYMSRSRASRKQSSRDVKSAKSRPRTESKAPESSAMDEEPLRQDNEAPSKRSKKPKKISKMEHIEEKPAKILQEKKKKRRPTNRIANALNNYEQTQLRKREHIGDNQYQTALNFLQENYSPDEMMCRDSEKRQIKEFIKSGLKNGGNSQTLCTFYFYPRYFWSSRPRQNCLRL